jgi:hypothetical protein
MPCHPFGGALLVAVAFFLVLPSIVQADPAPAAATATPAVSTASPAVAAPDASTLTPEQQAALQAAIIKSSQNPVGNIAIIPFQNNWNDGYGPYQRTQYNLNVQPVVPIQLSPNANLIARVIIPFVNQPSAAPPAVCSASAYGCPYNFGIGDINPQFYFAPKTDPNGLIWGAGAQFLFPTGSAANLTVGKYGAGPAIVGLIMPGNIVTGVLVTQMWSIGGDPTRPNISSLFIQPFFNYNLKGGWAIFFGSSGITANWTAPSGQKWLVPIGTGATKTFKLGDQPMQIGVQYFGNVVRPANTAYGTYRASFSLLFPIKRGAAPPPKP